MMGFRLVPPVYRDGCGYIHHSDSNKKGAVSGPAHDYFCGPDEMKMWPCNTKFVRTYKNDNPGNLGNCYARIPGLTQTCHYYRSVCCCCLCVCASRHRVWRRHFSARSCTRWCVCVICRECGSRTHVSDWNKDVCESDTGDYYKEPEVQRMCGICDMFHAELADSRDTPDEFGKKKEGGCIADSGVVWRRDAGNATRAKVGELRVDDVVWTWQGWRRVYYIMAHRQPVATVRLAWEGGSVEVSRHHLLPVVKTALLAPGASEMACGTGAASLKAAADVAAGDAVLVPHPRMGAGTPASVCTLARVQQREERTSQVRYVLVEGDSLVVSGDADRLVEQTGGAVVSVFSSPLREWETRPFRALDAILPGSLQWAPVAIALEQALGSPMLLWAESVVRAVDKCVAHVHAPAGRRSGEGEQKAAPCMRCVGAGSGEWGKGVF